MNDQIWGALAGVAALILLRIADWYLPKGRMSKWARDHSVKADEDDDDDDDQPSLQV